MARMTSRLGFVYYPDDRHFTRRDLELWLPILRSLGARWLTLRAPLARAIPESFLQGWIDAGIQPIVHIPARVDQPGLADTTSLLECYRRWGLRHVVLYDRPNQRAAWPASEWGKSGLVERFLDRLVPILQAEQAAGLVPVLPPLEPGGDYWDTAFLTAVLAGLQRRGQQPLLRDLHLALYSFPGEHPIDWGAGGPKRWPKAQPYALADETEDHRGFRIFEWYAAIAEQTIGMSLPTIALAGGVSPADQTAESLAAHAERNVEIARTIASEEPAELTAFCFHCLTAQADSAEASAAWFAAPDQPLPVVGAYRRLLQEAPHGMPVELRPLRKYILLPAGKSQHADRLWTLAGKLARLDRAAVGYSMEDACLASDVTLIGDALSHGQDVEPRLRAAGCEVRRIDPATLEALPLDDLAGAAPFPANPLVSQE